MHQSIVNKFAVPLGEALACALGLCVGSTAYADEKTAMSS